MSRARALKLAPGKTGSAEKTFFQKAEVKEALDLLSTGPITLVVGAGASAEVGFPTWPQLLERLLDLYVEVSVVDVGSIDTLRRRVRAEADPMAQADLLAQIAGERAHFEALLERALYSQVDEWTRPGPTARAVARLFNLLNPEFSDEEDAQCHLATTNFDLMLEIALREQLMKKARRQRKSASEIEAYLGRHVVSHFGDNTIAMDGQEMGKARIRHLHGCIPGKHKRVFRHEGLRRNEIILTGTDFMRDSDPWFERFLRQRMKTDHLLFVGASMADQHLLRSILHGTANHGKDRRAVALIPRSKETGVADDQWVGHDRSDIFIEESRGRFWRDTYNTITLFPDWYVQVSQFVEELIQRRCYPVEYEGYEPRLESWFSWFSSERLCLDRDGSAEQIAKFRKRQTDLNRVARGWVASGDRPRSKSAHHGVLEHIAGITGEANPGEWSKDTGECLAVHLWTRVPYHDEPDFRRHRELALTVCSDRIWQHPQAVDTRRITYPTRRTAIEAFISGYTTVKNTSSRDLQWNFVAAIPVRLPEGEGRAPLTVGVLCIQSNMPWTYLNSSGSLYEGAKLRRIDGEMTPYEFVNRRPAPVTVLRLAHEHWVRGRSPRGHAPLDTVLAALAKSATQLILDPAVFAGQRKAAKSKKITPNPLPAQRGSRT